jgi:hypothetical protein
LRYKLEINEKKIILGLKIRKIYAKVIDEKIASDFDHLNEALRTKQM